MYIESCASHVPALRSVEDAIAAGECERRHVTSMDVRSVAVSPDLSGPELAARAARTALGRARSPVDDIALVLHASAWYQGIDMWSPASYVQREAVGGNAPAMEVRQVCNGGLAALDLARCYLDGHSGGRALVTTGDRFGPPGFDRWRSDPGSVYGDAGTALLLSTDAGFARLRSLVSVGEPALEEWHRAGHPFGTVPMEHEPVVDMGSRQKRYLAAAGRTAAVTGIRTGTRRVVDLALETAGVTGGEITWTALPHLGAPRLRTAYYGPLGLSEDRTAWSFGRTVGHLGAGDAFAALEHLMLTDTARPGDLCLLVGVGVGFNWSAAVVEILEPMPAVRDLSAGGRSPCPAA